MTTSLVTGGNGYFGQLLVQRLAERGDDVASDVHTSLHYASRSAVITTSMALIPMNGMMTPPTP